MKQFKQKLKYGTETITFVECENPSDSTLTSHWSNSGETCHTQIIKGENAIRRFRDWINLIGL